MIDRARPSSPPPGHPYSALRPHPVAAQGRDPRLRPHPSARETHQPKKPLGWVVLRSHQLIARVRARQAQPPRLGLKVRQGTHRWPRFLNPRSVTGKQRAHARTQGTRTQGTATMAVKVRPGGWRGGEGWGHQTRGEDLTSNQSPRQNKEPFPSPGKFLF